MKRFGLVIVSFFMILVLASCGDDSGLVGTKWRCYFTRTDEDGNNQNVFLQVDGTFLFENETSGTMDFKMNIIENGVVIYTIPELINPFTYTYDGSESGTITTVGEGLFDTGSFYIEGNEMVFTASEDTMTFVKQ